MEPWLDLMNEYKPLGMNGTASNAGILCIHVRACKKNAVAHREKILVTCIESGAYKSGRFSASVSNSHC